MENKNEAIERIKSDLVDATLAYNSKVSVSIEDLKTLLSAISADWVKVDRDNLPTEEVIAYRAGEETIVGYLVVYGDIVVCDSLAGSLYQPTHYKIFLPPTE